MKRPAILINAVHHARELTTISMANYFVLKLLHGYLNGDAEAWKVLEDAVVFVIPVVNQDGFSAINQHFETNGKLALIRKNRHFYSTQAECSDEQKGVDLNRNYPYKFAFDNQGSSGERRTCYDDYRGPYAGSEPETQAMMTFVDKWTNLKVVLNLHAFGNMLIQPFNYDTEANEHLVEDFPIASQFYNHLWSANVFPESAVRGNGALTVGYTANGEASDYFLGVKKIISMSPELGTGNSESSEFFLNSESLLLEVLSANYVWIEYTLRHLFYQLEIVPSNQHAWDNVSSLEYTISNHGLEDMES